MSTATLIMSEQRQRDVEALARSMLSHSMTISPGALADRAGISWFLARDILQGLAKKGLVEGLSNGQFRRPKL